MLIKNEFSRFMHGVVLAEISKIGVLYIADFNKALKPRYLSRETLKKVFKYLDLNYPRNKNLEPLSYTKLNKFEMLSHLKFLELVLMENKIMPKWLKGRE